MIPRVIPEDQVGSNLHKKLLPGPSGACPELPSRRVRIFLHKDDPLAAGVEQQLDTGHARAGCHVARVDAVDVLALEHGVLLRVDRLTAIKVRATR